jgi:hypothetical protein
MSYKRKRSASPVNEADVLCNICSLMTGSLDGFAALMSSDGYKHHSKADLEMSASNGCICCKMLLAKTLEEWSGTKNWFPRIVALDGKGLLLRPVDFSSGQQKLCSLRYKKARGIDTMVFDIYISATEGKYKNGY